jgi:glycosyltransferase involved in cell wall biosynthesis
MTKLSVVVIGRNEGQSITDCLNAVKAIQYPSTQMEVIYVDSASDDDSVQRAHACGAKILHLKDCKPTAALARNLGWQNAGGEYILFLDGDTTVDPEFVPKSLPFFENPLIGVISGNVKEKYPEQSVYHRVLDIDWKKQTGIADNCGGNALIRRSTLEQVGGFNGMLKVGEEPEMCERIKSQGAIILQLDLPMVSHDLDIHNFRDYWKRCLRTGYAYASISDFTKDSRHPLWKQRARFNLLKTSVFFILVLLSLIYLLDNQWLPLLFTVALITLLIARTAFRAREQDRDWKTSLAYGLHSHFQHIPMLLGQLAYWISKPGSNGTPSNK